MAFEDWFIAHARVTRKEHRAITLDDKMVLFQQLAALVSSGTQLLQAIQISAQQSQSVRLRNVLLQVAGHVAAGGSLHGALEHHRNVFEDHWIELIGTGEVSGKMSAVLADLNEQIRESHELRRKVSGALLYPMILLVVAVLVVAIMLSFVVPTFADMFAEMGAELPGITQLVMDASDLIVTYGLYVLVGIVLFSLGLRQYLRTEVGRRRANAIGLALPIVGELMVLSSMHRFASNLSLLLRSGVSMMDTLSALAAAFRGRPIYRDAILHAQSRIAAGRSLAESLEETDIFTSMITNMVRVGEESAQLANVMEQVSPYYKEKVNSLVSKLTKLLEPCIIVVMGGATAVVMLAIYLPMFEMAGKVH